MSMTLRSKSADHRRHQLLESSQLQLHGGILGSSRSFLDQVGATATTAGQLKRAHSSFVPNAANIGKWVNLFYALELMCINYA